MKALLFARAPRLGVVKTRLAATIGEPAALRIYREMGASIAEEVGEGFDLTVYFDPPDAEQEMRDWLGDVECRSQESGDLGDRLRAAFGDHFRLNPQQPAVAIGADAPGLNVGVMETAEHALKNTEIVLGPSVDGGYYLIGLRQPMPDLFRDVPWGSDQVFDCTLRRCRELGIEPQILQSLRDVDTEEDARKVGVL